MKLDYTMITPAPVLTDIRDKKFEVQTVIFYLIGKKMKR